MDLNEKTLNKSTVFSGKIINLRSDTAVLPNGDTATREVVEHPGGVCVAAIDENDNILLVKQFRYPYMESLLEIPAGKRDKAGDSDPLTCGKRELKEETGAVANTYISLGQLYPTPGYCNEIIYMFAAKDLEIGNATPDDDEFLDLVKIPFEAAVKMVMSGEIKDSKTQAAILKLKVLKDNGEFQLMCFRADKI